MLVFSNSVDDVLQNLMKIQDYANGSTREKKFHFDRVFNAEHQVCYYTPDGPIFAPIKWCGARANDIVTYFENNKKISQEYQRAVQRSGFVPISSSHSDHDRIYEDFVNYCLSYDFRKSSVNLPHSNSRDRTFWINPDHARSNPNLFPDEIDSPDYPEGAKSTVTVNRYERSSKARLQCIAHYGCKCVICEIDFGERYGPIGRDFIHVHHLKEISRAGGEYTVDPINDLRPVCPNCHSMIHRRQPAYTIEDVKEMFSG